MARLPQPGGDDGTWGDVLNEFLSVAHNDDGSLKPTGAAVDTAVVHNTGNETINGIKTFTSSPVLPAPISGTQAANKSYVDTVAASGAPDASGTTKGIVQLTGDLGGTASSPTVPGLAGKANTSHTHAISDVTNLQTSLNSKADDTAVVHNTLVDAKGDILTAAADNTPARLGVGVDGQVLNADSTKSTGLAWVTMTANGIGALSVTEKGASSGVATLDGSGKVPTSELPDLSTTYINVNQKGQPNGVAQLDGSGKVNPGQLQTSNITKVLPYSYLGNLVVNVGTFRLYNDTGSTWTITGVRASVGVAPTGSSIIIDVNKNGTTIFTTQANRPAIAVASNTSGNVTNMDVTTVAAGEYLTVDVDQIGSTVSGSDLTIQLEVY